MNNAPVALQAIEKAIAIDPDNHEWLLQKALCLSKLGKIDLLPPLIERLTHASFDTAYQYSTMALVLTHVGRHEQAFNYYQQAVNKEPGDAQHYYNLASSLRFLGDITAAEDNYNKAIVLNPQDYEAYRLRSELRKQTDANNHVDELTAIVEAENVGARGTAQVSYALAKEFEDIGDSQRSFHFLTIGAKARRDCIKYDPSSDLRTIDAIQNVFTADVFDHKNTNRALNGSSGKTPIFILGLPRTGTTLVERIVSSHSEVVSAGELNNFSVEMLRQVKAVMGSKSIPKEQLVGLTKNIDFRALGEAYIDSTHTLVGESRYFIDKLPLNYLYVGLIRLALPQAKIINLKRHPLDTCYAMYKQLFKDAYPFSYDLEELGHYYLAYQRLMDHWNTVMPGVIHTVSYEDVVHDIEGQTKNLLHYCDLSWQAQCLTYYKNREASTTASATQVRKPVYKSSVGLWRNYQKQLQPLIRVLNEGGIQIDGV
ncbi:MAG: sulfotransferase [Agarilytica sp.]